MKNLINLLKKSNIHGEFWLSSLSNFSKEECYLFLVAVELGLIARLNDNYYSLTNYGKKVAELSL